MPAYLSNELAGTTTGLTVTAEASRRAPATVYGARLKRLRATFTLAGQLITDTLIVGALPAGAHFAFGVLNTTVTLGSSTLAIGVAGATGRYRAAAAFTTADTPTFFGPALQAGAANPFSTDENVFITIAGATLPSSGTLVVDLFYSQPN